MFRGTALPGVQARPAIEQHPTRGGAFVSRRPYTCGTAAISDQTCSAGGVHLLERLREPAF
eukprot:scaffold24768_cov146-Isochrysis_galbana.AAC.1